MAKPWSEVAASDGYLALSAPDQDAARQQYFNTVVAPMVPVRDRASVWQQFDADTATVDRGPVTTGDPLTRVSASTSSDNPTFTASPNSSAGAGRGRINPPLVGEPIPQSSGSIVKDLAINAKTGLLGGVAGAGAALADAAGADDVAASLDNVRRDWQEEAKRNGGDTIPGKAASLVGAVAPAFLVPAVRAAQLVSNAGLFAIPAFRDTLKSQLDEGKSFPLALAHASEDFGINLFLPTVATRGSGAIVKGLGAADAKGLQAAATGLGQAAGEGAAFSAAASATHKVTDELAGEPNDKAWLDLHDIAGSMLGFTVLRGAHMAPQAASAIADRTGSASRQFGRALGQDVQAGQFDTTIRAPQENPNLAAAVKPDPIAKITSAATVDDAIAAAQEAANQGSLMDSIRPLNNQTLEQELAALRASQPKAADVAQDAVESADANRIAPTADDQSAQGVLGATPRDGAIQPADSADARAVSDAGRVANAGPDAESSAAEVAPAKVWFGRRGDGYLTSGDAQMAIPSRTKIAPELNWQVEAMPSGKFRLAGYADEAVKSADATRTVPVSDSLVGPSGTTQAGQDSGQSRLGAGVPVATGIAEDARPGAELSGRGQTAPELVDKAVTPTPPTSGVSTSERIGEPAGSAVSGSAEKEPWQMNALEFSQQRKGNPHFDQSFAGGDSEYLKTAFATHEKLVAEHKAKAAKQPAVAPEPWVAADENIKPYADSLPALSDKESQAEYKRTADALNKWANDTPTINEKDGKHYLNPRLHSVESFEVSARFNAVNKEIDRRKESPAVAPEQPTAPAKEQGSAVVAPERFGRDNTPLGEGGKPFTSKLAALRFQKENSPQSRVVKVEGGFALRDPTDKEIAAGIEAGKRMQAAARAQSYEKNPLLTFLAEHGLYHVKGDPRSQKTEFSPDANPFIRGYGPIFKSNGEQPDTLAAKAADAGYLPKGTEDEAAFTALIRRAFAGERIAPTYREGQVEQEAARRMPTFEDMMGEDIARSDLDITPEELGPEYERAAPEIQAEVNALVALADARGIDTEAIKEDAAHSTSDQSEEAYYATAKQALQAALARSGEDRRASPGTPGDAADQASQEGLSAPPAKASVTDLSQYRQARAAAEAMQKAERDEILFDLDTIQKYHQTGAITEAEALAIVNELGKISPERQNFDDVMEVVDPLMTAAGDKYVERLNPANDSNGLTRPTPADIISQQERAAQAEREQKAADKAAQDKAKQEREQREIQSRQDASAEHFELGQNAEDSLSGQGPMFARKGLTRQERDANFRRWSNDAPLVTSAAAPAYSFKSGQKVVVEAYHGAQRPDRIGSVFQRKRATSGPMAFFTSEPELASNYAKGKSDTSLANEDQAYETWFKYKPQGQRTPVDIARAWHFLPRETQAKIAELAPRVMFSEEQEEDGGNKIVLGPEGHDHGTGGYDQHIKEARGNHLKALVEEWLNSANLFNDEERFLKVLQLAGFPVKDVTFDNPNAQYPSVYKTFVFMQSPLVTSDIPQNVRDALNQAAKRDRSRAQQGGADMWDKNTRTLREWVSAFNGDQSGLDPAYAWTSIPDKVTDVLKSLGYDGIIDWSGKGGGTSHPVYIPFEETQVKNAIGNKGTFDRNKRDINFQRGDQSSPGLTREQFTSALSEAFGPKVAERLEQNGVVIPLADQSSLPAHVVPFVRDGEKIYGFYDPKTDRTYATLSNLTPDMVKGLTLHEVGVHFGLENLIGREKYTQVIARVKMMGKAGNAEVKAALEQAQKNASSPRQVPEEVIAYLVGAHPEMGIVREVVAKIKAFLFTKFGIGGKYLTADDITALAKAAVLHASRTEPGSRAPDFARGTTEPMASRKDVVGESQGGRSADDNNQGDRRNELAREYMEYRQSDPARAKAAFQAMSAIDAKEREAEAAQPKQADTYKGEHEAPMRDSGAPLHDLKGVYPDDFYGPDGQRFYGVGDGSDARAMGIVRSLKGRQHAQVTVYRAIPKDVNARIARGDWVTIDRQYAKDHGDSALNGEYKIIRKTVQANELFTNGDSIQEWGYDPIGSKPNESPAPDSGGASFLRSADRTPQTETEPFKKWFSGSKAVDRDGRPLVVYHGTTSDIRSFSDKHMGGSLEWADGSYFKDTPQEAAPYAQGEGGNIMPVYLSLKNPADNKVMLSKKVQDALDGDPDSVRQTLQDMGYDGIALKQTAGTEYVVFRPEQVKSAIGNRGTFDGDNEDIRFARGNTADEAPRDEAPKDRSNLADKLAGGYHAYAGVEQVPRESRGSVADSIAKALIPAGRQDAMLTAGIIRANLGEQARGREVAQQHLMEFAKSFDKMPVAENYKFIDAMERGVPLKDPELARAAVALRKVLDERRDQVIALGKGNLENFNENYFPHIWKDKTAAANFFTRRPLEGGKGFLKQRTYDYFADGIKAGLEPVTTNPVELAMLKAREMDRYIYGQRIFGEMKAAGIAKFVAFGGKAPDGWVKINDKIARVMQYSEAEKGMILRGEYYAPEQPATLINNHLSPGLSGVAAFDMVRKAGNMMNAVQLGMSAFHLGFTTLDAMISKAALGIKQVSRGDVLKGVGNMAQSLNPAQPVMNLIKGDKLLKAYLSGLADPDLAPIVEALTQAGGRVKMDDVYRNAAVNEFRQAVRKGNYGTAALKVIPRAMDLINKPIFEYLVPRQKLGVFFDMAKDAMEKNPDMGLDEKRQVMGRLWDSVDNRMGELVYDNVFWNRALKDALMVSVRSVGWNLGTFREIGGGVKDLKDIPKLGGFSDRTAYLFALPFITAIIGSMTQYLMTGEGPQELKDVFFPRTGKERPDGTQDRLSLPSYMKDIAEYGHDLRNFAKYGEDPFHTLENKMHPLISTLGQVFTNKDFFGGAIRSPGDTPSQQALDEAAYMLKQMTPFSLRNYQQQAKVKGEEPSIAGYLSSPSMIGIVPAPGYITKNDEQAQSSQVNKMHDSLMTKFREEMRDGADWPEIRQRAVDAGIRGRDLDYIRQSAVQRPPKRMKEFATH